MGQRSGLRDPILITPENSKCMHACNRDTNGKPTCTTHHALHLTLAKRTRTQVLKAAKSVHKMERTVWNCERGCGNSFLMLLLSFLLWLCPQPLSSHVSKSIILIINTYPDGFYSKELDWKDNERKTDAGRWKKLVKSTEAYMWRSTSESCSLQSVCWVFLLAAFSQVQMVQHCKEQSETEETE